MVKVLFPNKWVELRELILPEDGVNGYVYSHEKRCNGHIVSVLPYLTDNDHNIKKLMIRMEVTPCWGMNPVMSSITGGVEPDESGALDPLMTAVKELDEEAGLKVDPSDVVSLGTCRGVKSSDTIYHLYAVDAAGAEKTKAVGDGSHLESLAWCAWVRPENLREAQDPLLAMLFVKLVFYS